jgi:hypothetical protein
MKEARDPLGHYDAWKPNNEPTTLWALRLKVWRRKVIWMVICLSENLLDVVPEESQLGDQSGNTEKHDLPTRNTGTLS